MSVYQQLMTSSEDDPELVSKFGDEVVRFNKVAGLFAIYDEFPEAQPFLKSALRALTARQDADRLFTAETLVTQFSVFRSALSTEELETLVELGCSKMGLRDAIVREPFSSDLSDLYLFALRCSGSSDALRDFLAGSLHSVSNDTWSEELASEGQLVELAIELVDGGLDVALSTEFEDALFTHAEQLVTGDVQVQRLQTKWDKVLLLLPAGLRDAFFYRISDLLCDADQPVTDLLDIYGTSLANAPAIKRNAERVVLQAFLKMLNRQDLAELRWMKDVLRDKQLLSSVGQSARSDFVERLKNITLEDLDDDLKKIISAIRSEAGIIDDST